MKILFQLIIIYFVFVESWKTKRWTFNDYYYLKLYEFLLEFSLFNVKLYDDSKWMCFSLLAQVKLTRCSICLEILQEKIESKYNLFIIHTQKSAVNVSVFVFISVKWITFYNWEEWDKFNFQSNKMIKFVNVSHSVILFNIQYLPCTKFKQNSNEIQTKFNHIRFI